MKNENNIIVVLLGAPGAGKTTLRSSLPFARQHHINDGRRQGTPSSSALRADWRKVAESWDLNGRVLLDGFPRSVEQARWLLQNVPLERLKVVWCPLDRETSVRAQMSRGDSPERARAKYDRYLAQDVPAVAHLATCNAQILQLRRRSPELMLDDVLQFLGHDVQSFPWDWEGIVAVDRALRGMPWRLVHGSVYRPVFAGLGAGPASFGSDLDIQVATEHIPAAREAVSSISGRKVSVHDQTTDGLPWASQVSCLHLRTWATVSGGRIQLGGDAEALEALLTGHLAPLDSVRGPAKIQRILQLFPGLGRDPQEHTPGGRVLAPSECEISQRVRALAPVLERVIPLPPVFARQGSRPLLQLEQALVAPDDIWRDWLVRMTVSHDGSVRAHDPAGTATLLGWLGCAETSILQPVHMGQRTSLHHVLVGYYLSTSGLSDTDRRALRIAALIHDIGKRRGQHVSGCHGRVGARMVERGQVPGLAPDAQIARLVREHDIPGAVIKGILAPGQPGALPPSALMHADDLVWRLWRADVSAIAKYRWTLELELALRN